MGGEAELSSVSEEGQQGAEQERCPRESVKWG